MKFEAAYFRSLFFDDPPRERAQAVYDKYRGGGVPSLQEYTDFQDFIFRQIVADSGRLHLAVHIHTNAGGGDYFNVRNVNVLNLENVVRDPRYQATTFVLIHGGYPFDRQAIFLASMKNVYLDSSGTELILYPSEFMRMARRPLLRGCRFSFVVSFNEKIMRIGRQIPDMAHIFQGSFQIKKYRLIVWIHCVKRLTHWNDRVNLRGDPFYLLPVLQSESGERIAYRANHKPDSNKRHHHLLPCPLASHPHSLRPMQRLAGVTHRQQPRSWN